jgi:hypothetical protein
MGDATFLTFPAEFAFDLDVHANVNREVTIHPSVLPANATGTGTPRLGAITLQLLRSSPLYEGRS